jgi:hypothetical protein
MTLKVSEFDLERFASYGEFRGDRWGLHITFGKKGGQNFIFLEGVLLCYVSAGLDEDKEFLKSTMRIFPGEPLNINNVGRWSFWFDEEEVHCQIELIAPQKVFDSIFQALAAKRPEALFNIFLTTDLKKLSKEDNCITEYSIGFIEK